MAKFILWMALGVGFASTATQLSEAAPIEVHLLPVDNSSGGPVLDGFTTTDIILTIPELYIGSQMLIELEQGTIFQHPLGGWPPPHPILVAQEAALAFDTYVAYGEHVPDGRFGPVVVYGGAVNLKDGDDRGDRPLTGYLDVAWGPTPGINLPHNTDGFVSARVTLSSDAVGRWLYLASSDDEFTVVVPEDHPYTRQIPDSSPEIIFADSGLIRSGQLQLVARVPEPATLPLMLAATTMAIGSMKLAARDRGSRKHEITDMRLRQRC